MAVNSFTEASESSGSDAILGKALMILDQETKKARFFHLSLH